MELRTVRSIIAVPFLALGEVHLKAVEPPEVPRWTGERHPHFLVDSPNIPVHPEALAIHRANRLKRIVQRVTITIEPRRIIFAANRERDRPGGKIEQVAVNGRIVNWQLIFAGILQVHIDPGSGRPCIMGIEIHEGIKRCGRIRIQQRVPQPGLAGLTYRYVFPSFRE